MGRQEHPDDPERRKVEKKSGDTHQQVLNKKGPPSPEAYTRSPDERTLK